MIPEDRAKALGLLYHLNSDPHRDSPPANPPRPPEFKTVPSEWPPVGLPRPGVDSSLMGLIRARRSCRSYRPGTLPLADLAQIVRGAYGMSEALHSSGWHTFLPRAVPSAGGRYPLELYVAAWTVGGIEAGLYHYDILGHSLEVVRLGDLRAELCRGLVDPTQVADACAVLILTAIFHRTLARYGARGYRYVLFEAGHAAQNTCLIATEMGLGSLCLGGFFDARLNRFLGLDGVTEAVLYSVAFGYPKE